MRVHHTADKLASQVRMSPIFPVRGLRDQLNSGDLR